MRNPPENAADSPAGAQPSSTAAPTRRVPAEPAASTDMAPGPSGDRPGGIRSRESGTVPVRFEVEVPAILPEGKSVFVAGSPRELGHWHASAVRLERTGPRLWTSEIHLPRLTYAWYKCTLGSWETVEQAADGSPILDRELMIIGPSTVRIKVERWADGRVHRPPRTRDEHVVDFGSFGKKVCGVDRMVWVHVPPGYEADGHHRYPLIYLLDGQNIFDAAIAFAGQPWDADKIHDDMVSQGKIPPVFLAAIEHKNDREDMFTPVKGWANKGGKVDLLARIIREEIDPALRTKYRLLKDTRSTGIVGSSLGGLGAFHLGFGNPGLFGSVAAMSPSLWWGQGATLKMVRASRHRSRSTRFWVDVGTHESERPERPVTDVTQLVEALEKKGYPATLYVDVGARHTEYAWKRRLPDVLKWMLSKEK